jgi:CPA1 family monovalent cation:H+ antiporter
MLSIFEIAALLLSLSALFGWINLRFLKLPHTIGLLIMALASSLLLLGIQKLFPGLGITATLQAAIGQIDFYTAIMNGILAFLLFAGALHVDLVTLKGQKWAIGLMASVGVVISIAVCSTGLWLAAGLLGFDVSFAWALVFGALISPTDPVAVLGLLKTVDVPAPIKAKIAGEALFNDGAAVVAFSVLLGVALGVPGHPVGEVHESLWSIAAHFLFEGVGGIVFGLVTGWIAYRAMAAIDDAMVEILISIGVCAATYALSIRLNVSGPIAVVVTGLLIGNHGAEHAMSEKVQEYLFSFWEVIDELLNSILFLLIGLEVLVLAVDPAHAWIVLAAIPIVLLARLISVSVPIWLLSIRQSFSPGSIPILTWGGLRGGVSVALALSLPDSPAKPVILAATYAVVIFSIIVQGLTVKWVIRQTADLKG